MKEAIEAFEKYVHEFDLQNEKIALKYRHTYRVVENAKILAKQFHLSLQDEELLLKCALLHDIGRFYQVKQFDSFQDGQMDHASYGIAYLFQQGHISLYEKNKANQEVIRQAVYYHNKHEDEIPKLDERTRFFVELVRDVDKIDIYKVYADEILLAFCKEDLSLNALETFQKQHSIHYQKEKKKNQTDSFLVACGFIFDINYKESYQLLKEKGYLENFFKKVQVAEDSYSMFETIKKAVFQKLEEEVLC